MRAAQETTRGVRSHMQPCAAQMCLRNLKTKRTTVTVAHRLSTVMDADMIVVLDDGAIRETGSHHELVQRGGLYSQLWQRQLSSPSVDDLAAAAADGQAGNGQGGGGQAGAEGVGSPASAPSPRGVGAHGD
jgi:hypothetical protein